MFYSFDPASLSTHNPAWNTRFDRLTVLTVLANLMAMGYRQFSRKAILSRGCHPAMAHRAAPVLPSHLGNPKLVTCTDDDLLAKLSGQKWDVIYFAPGACRYNAAKQPIPEARAASKGWGLDQYRQLVREQQGKETKMVETVDERQIIPLLRDALEEL